MSTINTSPGELRRPVRLADNLITFVYRKRELSPSAALRAGPLLYRDCLTLWNILITEDELAGINFKLLYYMSLEKSSGQNWKRLFVNFCRSFKQLVIPLKTKRRPLYLKTQSVPRCKHFSSGL